MNSEYAEAVNINSTSAASTEKQLKADPVFKKVLVMERLYIIKHILCMGKRGKKCITGAEWMVLKLALRENTEQRCCVKHSICPNY